MLISMAVFQENIILQQKKNQKAVCPDSGNHLQIDKLMSLLERASKWLMWARKVHQINAYFCASSLIDFDKLTNNFDVKGLCLFHSVSSCKQFHAEYDKNETFCVKEKKINKFNC